MTHQLDMRRIATRKSKLAMWQADTTFELLEKLHFKAQIVSTETTGDKIQSSALSLTELAEEHPARRHVATGKGLFIKEVQDLLIAGNCHLAVHSMKDLPITQTRDLVLAGFLPAAPAADVLVLSPELLIYLEENGFHMPDTSCANPIFSSHQILKEIDQACVALNKTIGTTSTRRQTLLKCLGIEETQSVMLRGNVDTRLERLAKNDFAAIILAEAGLRRLKLFDSQKMIVLDKKDFIPACAQGVVGLETLASDHILTQALFRQSKKEDLLRMSIERLVLDLLEGDCQSAIGIHFEHQTLHVYTAPIPFNQKEDAHSTSLDLTSKEIAQSFNDWKIQIQQAHEKWQSFSELFEALKSTTPLPQFINTWLEKCGHFDNI